MPFGQVPALEVDGEVITQSFTIARFVAKQHGLGGKDNLAAAQADMVVDCLVDLLQRGTKNTQICLIQT
jgi:glutathione S-transferase